MHLTWSGWYAYEEDIDMSCSKSWLQKKWWLVQCSRGGKNPKLWPSDLCSAHLLYCIRTGDMVCISACSVAKWHPCFWKDWIWQTRWYKPATCAGDPSFQLHFVGRTCFDAILQVQSSHGHRGARGHRRGGSSLIVWINWQSFNSRRRCTC